MPYAKTTRRARTRRPRRKPAGVRKRTYKKRTLFRPQNILRVGFPRTTMVKLRYCDGVQIDPPPGGLGTHNFRANSCYDPDATGVGHQPMNFDLWSQLYNHYTVVGAKITARFFDDAASFTGLGFVGGINLSDDSTFTLTSGTMMEQGLSKYRMAFNTQTANAGRGVVVSRGFSCKKFFNITNPMDNTARVGAPTSANPSELAHFIVFVGPLPSQTADIDAFQVAITIDYIVIFSEPREQPQS